MDPMTKNRLEDLICRNELENAFWIAKNHITESIIQNGPQCGIVALAMALKYLNIECSVDLLMQQAKESNFTKNGEMFDVNYLNDLGKKYTECRVLDLIDMKDEKELLKCVLDSKLILIAYDCDFNFEPCKKQGMKAHWALITGISFPIDLNDKQMTSMFLNDNIDLNLLNLTDSFQMDQIDNLVVNYEKAYTQKLTLKDLTYVFCKHGKSKQIGVWNLKELIESNRQLKKVDDVKCNLNEFNRPLDGDIGKTLGSKFLAFI